MSEPHPHSARETPRPQPSKTSWWRRTRTLRRWLMCVLVGLAVGYMGWKAEDALSGLGRERVIAGMGEPEFVQRAEMTARGQVLLSDLVVHPEMDGKHLVTGRKLGGPMAAGADAKTEFEFLAAVPFEIQQRTGKLIAVTRPAMRGKPQPASGGLFSRLFGSSNSDGESTVMRPEVVSRKFADVKEFLTTTAAGGTALKWHYAWQEEPGARQKMWMGGGVGVFGVAMPLVVLGLRRTGVMQMPEEAPEMLPAYEEKKAPAPSVDTGAVAAQLNAVTAGMEEKLGVTAGAHGGEDLPGMTPAKANANTDPKTDTGEVVKLSGGPVEAAAPMTEREKALFDRGEFYPVARGTKKDS